MGVDAAFDVPVAHAVVFEVHNAPAFPQQVPPPANSAEVQAAAAQVAVFAVAPVGHDLLDAVQVSFVDEVAGVGAGVGAGASAGSGSWL